MNNKLKAKKYPPEAAINFVVTDVPQINHNLTIREVRKMLIKKINKFSTINYIYVLDDDKKLIGAFSIKELFHLNDNTQIKAIDLSPLVYVLPRTNKVRAAILSLKKSLKAVPVVDKDKVFLGVIPSDDIQQILYNEQTQQLLKLSGISHPDSYKKNIFSTPISKSLRQRLPWLVLGLIGGILTAGVVGHFEEVLSKNIILAAFIPLLVYMSDAVGTQMQAFIIRDLSYDSKLKFFKYFVRQASVAIVMGLIISLLLFIISLFLYNQITISLVLGVSLFLAIITALFSGLVVPFVFSRLKFDPADTSGPIATIIQDVISIVIYFLVASAIL